MNALLNALNRIELEPTADEFADLVWLATYITPAPRDEVASAASETFTESEAQEQLATPIGAANRADSVPYTLINPIASSPTQRAGQLFAAGSVPSSANREDTLPFRSPSAPALPGTLGLERALRPLMRKVPSRTETRLNEEATAERSAEERLLLPILEPVAECWLEAAILVDESRSMGIWRQTIGELREILERHGAFRRVQTWGLVSPSDSKQEIALYAGSPLAPGAKRSTSSRTRHPNELIEPTRRRLLLVVSDCVDPAWYDGRMARLLDPWTASCPVALVQMLPRRMWDGTALRLAPSVFLRAPQAGVPNQRLFRTFPETDPEASLSKGPLLPLVTLEADSLSSWARMVAGRGDAWTSGVVLPVPPIVSTQVIVEEKLESELYPTPQERLQDFQAETSPLAQQLALHFAAVPLTLPIMRVVQRAMLPESLQVHLAEVFLGDILRRTTPYMEGEDPEHVVYDFHSGVRELLLDALPTPNNYRVLQEVSTYVSRELGQTSGFAALLADPEVSLETLSQQNLPFALIAAQSLQRLGGRYAKAAARLNALQPQPRRENTLPSSNETNKTLPLRFPHAKSPARPVSERWALLIGINYCSDPYLPRFRYCADDVDKLQHELLNHGFGRERILILKNEDALRAKIQDSLSEIAYNWREDDLLLVHFSGYGEIVQERPLLFPYDTTRANAAEYGINIADQLKAFREDMDARIVVIVDAGSDSFVEQASKELESVFFLGSGEDEAEELAHGVLSYLVLESLREITMDNSQMPIVLWTQALRNRVRMWHHNRIRPPRLVILSEGYEDVPLFPNFAITPRQYVLWVDDKPANNASLRTTLEKMNFHITNRLSTTEALSELAERQYDLIISDIGRGKERQAGFDLLERLQTQDSPPPVIFYTSRAAAAHLQAEASKRGAFGCTSASYELLTLAQSAVSSRALIRSTRDKMAPLEEAIEFVHSEISEALEIVTEKPPALQTHLLRFLDTERIETVISYDGTAVLADMAGHIFNAQDGIFRLCREQKAAVIQDAEKAYVSGGSTSRSFISGAVNWFLRGSKGDIPAKAWPQMKTLLCIPIWTQDVPMGILCLTSDTNLTHEFANDIILETATSAALLLESYL